MLYNFLRWLLEGPDGEDESQNFGTKQRASNSTLDRRILFIAQDIIFSATDGLVKPPKHLALPLTVRHLTGSTQLVTMLNRFGHGVSASQLAELETDMAERLLDEQPCGAAFTPSTISKTSGIFVSFAWGNNDMKRRCRGRNHSLHQWYNCATTSAGVCLATTAHSNYPRKAERTSPQTCSCSATVCTG